MDVPIVREHFDKVLVGLDRLFMILKNPSLDGEDEVSFLGRQLLTELYGSARETLRLFAVAELCVGLSQLGIGQGEIRIPHWWRPRIV